MRVTLSQAVLGRLPDMEVEGLLVWGVNQAALPAATLALPEPDIDLDALLQRWKALYRELPGDKKARCSLEYLVKAAQKDKLRRILPLVDLYNQASLQSLAPFGGEDIDKLGGELRLDLARGDESFFPLGKMEAEQPQPHEAAWLNGDGEVVCCCLNWLESDRFKLDEASRNVAFVSERPDAGFPSGAAGMDWLARELAPHAGSLIRFRLDAAHPAFAM
ncbi:B3/B4 domain-containing protein [Chromobacterium amazonense]|uniref:Phenylalanine--tRNA ligase beta subunit-related protein n=1 Tax=Chromobacterium amazonense TaxID=1382803 RepID=A0ABU8V6B9_9NEIS|nr:phenylalanine--tRNA ligase beta subunit-related protein [Chromobacterium amazonense]MDQ4539471.1 phenylalanine--tRNA ligase beta subunit-related protein [Chromobacterium amazonense]